MKRTALLIAAGTLGAGAAALQGTASAADVEKAVAVLHSAKEGKVDGTITFTRTGDEVKVSGTVTGLDPGKHGFHVHEFGDCSAPDFSSAGGHFNPTDEPHGARVDEKRHVGDLGNIEAGPDGTATLSFTDDVLHLKGERGIVGHALVVHAKADDLKSQPSGDAGGRVACGVIGIAKAE